MPVEAKLWSEDCTPANSISGASRLATAAKTRAMAMGSDPSQAVIPDADRAIRALGEAFAQRFVDFLGRNGHDDDFDRFARGFLDLDGFFQGVIVPLVQVADEKFLIHVPSVRADLEVLVERGDLLDGHQNLHAGTASVLRAAGIASRMSSINSLTTNFPSLPVVLSASSNIVRSFGQLTTYTSRPGIAAASLDAILGRLLRPHGIGNPDPAAARAATERIGAAAAHLDELAAQKPQQFARRLIALVEAPEMAGVVECRAELQRPRHFAACRPRTAALRKLV